MILWLLACSGAPAGDSGTCHRDPPLEWANFGQGWMQKHCAGCHSSLVREDQRNGAPVGVDLDTWPDMLTWAERIDVRALDTLDMPPGGGPSEEERRLLREWLDCAVYPAKEAP